MKTAVEYTIQEIEKLAGIKISRDEDCIEKANKMFEQQIIEAFIGYDSDTEDNLEVAEQYYTETFKSK
jgi:hypothetical protein